MEELAGFSLSPVLPGISSDCREKFRTLLRNSDDLNDFLAFDDVVELAAEDQDLVRE
jgi:hypothetical protein